jgi:hypothetical protein
MEAAPPPRADARQPAKKFSLLFFCARRIFSSKRKRKLFCWFLLLTEHAAGLASIFRSGAAEFPPHPPFRRALAWPDGIFGGDYILSLRQI